MIIFSKVLGDNATVYDALRAGERPEGDLPDGMLRFSRTGKPVVVWNVTKRCNLRCEHCYLDAAEPEADELSLADFGRTMEDLAKCGVPLVIFSGGEPLLRRDFLDILGLAKDAGLRSVISTNGTLITGDMAERLAARGVRYVGVSLDAAHPEVHDRFRGVDGCWRKALDGVRKARDAGIRTGFRITVTRDNYRELPDLLELALRERVERFCVYHLVPTGRGAGIMAKDLDRSQREWVLSFLYEKAIELRDRNIEILTTDSPMDGVYILERLKREQPERYEAARRMLALGSGCTIGSKVANISHRGDVTPCHFAPEIVLGNVRRNTFSEIWNAPGSPLVQGLRAMPAGLTGKCGRCDYNDLCRGCRKRALFGSGDWMGEDPACTYDPPPGAGHAHMAGK